MRRVSIFAVPVDVVLDDLGQSRWQRSCHLSAVIEETEQRCFCKLHFFEMVNESEEIDIWFLTLSVTVRSAALQEKGEAGDKQGHRP